VTTYPDQVRRQERAEARKRRQRRRYTGPAIVTLRMAELFRYFNSSHGYGGAPLPDDDAGRDDLTLAFQVLSTTRDAAGRMVSVARVLAPWYPADELATLVADVAAHPRRFKADTIAARLGITAEIRTLLELRTIGAIDETAEQRAFRRKEKQRAGAEARRRRAGSIPQAVRRAAALGRTQPWKAANISRATWYRLKRRAVAWGNDLWSTKPKSN
jgi:hypothetical protein